MENIPVKAKKVKNQTLPSSFKSLYSGRSPSELPPLI